MNPGLFRNRITFSYSVKNADNYGGYVFTAGGTMETLWGYLKPKSGKYESSNGKRSKEKVVEIIIRKKDYESLQIPPGYSGNVDLDNNDIRFSISGQSGTYRVNDLYESDYNRYMTVKGTLN